MHFPFKKKKKERPKETKEIKLSTSAIKFTMPKYSYSLQIYSNILLRTVNMYVIDTVVVPFIPKTNLITLNNCTLCAYLGIVMSPLPPPHIHHKNYSVFSYAICNNLELLQLLWSKYYECTNVRPQQKYGYSILSLRSRKYLISTRAPALYCYFMYIFFYS